MITYLRLFSGKLLCLYCHREFSLRHARFHRLKCKSKSVSRCTIDGRLAAEDGRVVEGVR